MSDLVDVRLPGISTKITVWLSNGGDRSYMAMACAFSDKTMMPHMLEMISEPKNIAEIDEWHREMERKALESASIKAESNSKKKRRIL
jgi:hypothetical protein